MSIDTADSLALISLHPRAAISHRQFHELCQPRWDLAVHARVCLAIPNPLLFLCSFFSIIQHRLVAAPLNPAYKKSEALFYLKDTRPALVVVEEGLTGGVVDAAQELGIDVVSVSWHRQQMMPLVAKCRKRQPQASDLALILHTSGTTGRPKAVALTHGNLNTSASTIAGTYGLTERDCTLLVMPLFHVHGLIGAVLSTLHAGGTVVCPVKFSASAFWQLVDEHSVTWFTAVPTIHEILLRTPFTRRKRPLRFIRSCSSALSPTTHEAMEQRYQVPVYQAYAMTEAAHQMTSQSPKSHKYGSVGCVHGPVKIRILDGSGQPAERGEVCVQGPNVTQGYLDNPQANRASFFPGGWFRTGDQGYMDAEGALFLTGRLKELINRGGEKISPLEIDHVIGRMSGVVEVVSFAVPDPVYGEVVGVALVGTASPTQVQSWVREQLGDWKVPQRIWMLAEIPKTPTGKVQRLRVRAHCLEHVKAKL